jgi:outer membrane protein assembly factor BamB
VGQRRVAARGRRPADRRRRRAGESFLAFNKSDGKLAWKSGSEKITHATPTPATIHGVSQVIFFTQAGLVSVRAEDGKEMWRFAHRFNTSTASSPIVGGKDGDIVFCAAATASAAPRARSARAATRFTATKLWGSDGEYELHWTTPVYHDGHLYGIFGHRQLGKGPLKCVELETGKRSGPNPASDPAAERCSSVTTSSSKATRARPPS